MKINKMDVLVTLDPVEYTIVVCSENSIIDEKNIAFMPQLFAPWPDLQVGSIKLTINGNTIKDVVKQLSDFYMGHNIDFNPIYDNEISTDYDMYLNDRNCLLLSEGINTKLNTDDCLRIRMMTHWG